jgi:predicted O-linked N-acetylglucosamine transferase (SPINDLY family)
MSPEEAKKELIDIQALQKAGNHKEAFSRLEDYLRDHSKHALALYMAALSCSEFKNFAAASDFLERAIAQKSDEADWHRLLAESYFRLERHREAVSAMDAGRALQPGNTSLLMRLAELQESAGDGAAARQSRLQIVSIAPAFPRALLTRLILARQEKRPPEQFVKILNHGFHILHTPHNLPEGTSVDDFEAEFMHFVERLPAVLGADGALMRAVLKEWVEHFPKRGEAFLALTRLCQFLDLPKDSFTYLRLALRQRFAWGFTQVLRSLEWLCRRLDHDHALQLLPEVTAIFPRSLQLHHMAAEIALSSSQPASAHAYLDTAAELGLDKHTVFTIRGRIHTVLCENRKAFRAFHQALQVRRDSVHGLLQMTVMLLREERYHDALPYLRYACHRFPENKDLWKMRLHACVNVKPNRFPEANEEGFFCLARLRVMGLKDVNTLNGEAHLLQAVSRFPEAQTLAEESLRLDPDQTSLWRTYLFHLNYVHELDDATIVQKHRAWGRRFEEHNPARFRFDDWDRSPDRPLRLGFLTADLYFHPVAYFLHPLWKHLDSRQCEIYAYSQRREEDPFTKVLEGRCTRFHRVANLKDEALADLIHEDRVDILFDVSGHTTGSRPAVYAQRPAPLQVSWLAYANSLGLSRIDYRLSDAIVAPPEEEAATPVEQRPPEKLLRLPHGFHLFEQLNPYPAVGPLPCLENGFVTFGSFNNIRKITPPVVELWAEILRAVPRSRLLLKDRHLDVQRNRERLYSSFASVGIPARRLFLRGLINSNKEHLAAYNGMDIALDTFPYSGTTTTCEALAMGVPVVTYYGPGQASRVSASLLHHAGFSQWIAKNTSLYKEIACALASDPAELDAVRRQLRPRLMASPLTDAPRFAHDFTYAMRNIWHHWIDNNKLT